MAVPLPTRRRLPDFSESGKWALGKYELEDVSLLVRKHFEANRPDPSAFPSVATMVIDEAKQREASIEKLQELVECEPAITATVLRAANGPLTRGAVSVSNVRSAIMRLGAQQVANVAVGVACRALFDVEERTYHNLFPDWFGRVFHSAMTEAFAASFMAKQYGLPTSADLFMAGMLHEVGKSLALRSLAAVAAAGGIRMMPSHDSIEQVVEREHGYIGILAMRTWRIPLSIVETCRRLSEERVPATPEWTDAHVIRVVSALNDFRMGATFSLTPSIALRDSAQALGLDKETVLDMAQQVGHLASECSTLFSVPNPSDGSNYEERISRIVAML